MVLVNFKLRLQEVKYIPICTRQMCQFVKTSSQYTLKGNKCCCCCFCSSQAEAKEMSLWLSQQKYEEEGRKTLNLFFRRDF